MALPGAALVEIIAVRLQDNVRAASGVQLICLISIIMQYQCWSASRCKYSAAYSQD